MMSPVSSRNSRTAVSSADSPILVLPPGSVIPGRLRSAIAKIVSSFDDTHKCTGGGRRSDGRRRVIGDPPTGVFPIGRGKSMLKSQFEHLG